MAHASHLMGPRVKRGHSTAAGRRAICSCRGRGAKNVNAKKRKRGMKGGEKRKDANYEIRFFFFFGIKKKSIHNYMRLGLSGRCKYNGGVYWRMSWARRKPMARSGYRWQYPTWQRAVIFVLDSGQEKRPLRGWRFVDWRWGPDECWSSLGCQRGTLGLGWTRCFFLACDNGERGLETGYRGG